MRRAEPGEWPKLEAALAVVNRDLTATLPDQDPLILMVDGDQVNVAMSDGRWHGNSLNEHAQSLAAVADAAQSTVMELLRQTWPICREHKLGVHLRVTETDADAWWCQGRHEGESHEFASWASWPTPCREWSAAPRPASTKRPDPASFRLVRCG